MDAREMSADELMELARSKAGAAAPAPAPVRTLRGLSFQADPARLRSWKALSLMGEMQSDNPFERTRATMGFCTYITGLDEERIVEACGGEDADASEVLGFAQEIILSFRELKN